MNHINQNLTFLDNAFGNEIELLSGVSELFELELAHLEYKTLPKEQILERTAFIKSIKKNLSRHFLLYSGIQNLTTDRSKLTNNYFKEGQFSTGYATHGLFPYRGKFHPQLVKGLLNILNLQKGDIVIDPMAGSGTLNIEAALLGIDSIAIDVSPLCQFMIQTKYDSLKIDPNFFKENLIDLQEVFDFFCKGNVFNRINEFMNKEIIKVYNLFFLAFLDSMGYARRVTRNTHRELFIKVHNRYIETVKYFINNKYYDRNLIGAVNILRDSDALNIQLNDESVDCIITSPPYSFAIDYIENDREQLEFLGYDCAKLKNNLIGLKGKTKKEKLENYFHDIETFCKEVARILKRKKNFVVIIGSNTNQTGGIQLQEVIINSAKSSNMQLIKSILKPIRGMRNTMKNEYILFFKKETR
jgi:DNA modification methylase